tara:strand:- start:353 stop:670 length:318 start_codon:yes stop_codon:yes gene_type:complete
VQWLAVKFTLQRRLVALFTIFVYITRDFDGCIFVDYDLAFGMIVRLFTHLRASVFNHGFYVLISRDFWGIVRVAQTDIARRHVIAAGVTVRHAFRAHLNEIVSAI